VLPGIIGALQAAEALKLLLGRGTPLCGRLLLLDVLELRFRELALSRDRDCAVCGERPSRRALVDDVPTCAAPGVSPTTDGVAEILPAQLEQRLLHGDRPLLLDVRTPQEWAICRLEGARLIPIQELVARLGELDPAQEIVAYCHHGIRGRAAAELLRERGFSRVANLAGGLDGWACEVDPGMPRY
jgi:adenylyltransferase/sulfurtransferase